MKTGTNSSLKKYRVQNMPYAADNNNNNNNYNNNNNNNNNY
jgi:hypothetical protein